MKKVIYNGRANIKLVYNDKVFKPERGKEYPLTPEMEEITTTFPGYFEYVEEKKKTGKSKKKKSGGKKS